MKFTLMGMEWDLKPIFIFIWLAVGLSLFAFMILLGYTGSALGFFLCATGCFLWVYISETLERNGRLNID